MPADANVSGDIFGGWVLSQMDLASGIIAGERAQGRVATVAVDAMKFIRPVRIGDVLEIYGWVARVGRTSMGIGLEAWVIRNRIGTQRMVNKEKMERAINMLSKRIGFRVAPGFSERVIFRELFPRGLTLLDLKDIGVKQLNISNIAARQELRDMMKEVNLPGVEISI
nr:division plane positioning ATPase MipZ [Leisingera sp. F5]